MVSMSDCYVVGLLIESGIIPLLKHACGEAISCHAGHQEVGRYYTRGESQGIFITFTYMLLPSANKTAHSSFETQRKCHQKSRTEISVAPQKELMSSKNFLKNTN